MWDRPPLLAPPALIVRYLAIFHRAFVAVADYSQRGDRHGIVMGGYLANALHNVPGMLWNREGDTWYTPSRMEELLDGFPEEMLGRGVPAHLVADCKRIVSHEGVAEELGVSSDLSDLDLVPLTELRLYLESLWRACLSMRLMRKQVRWEELPDVWPERAIEQAMYNGWIVTALVPLPIGLVHWHQFDAEQFHKAMIDRVVGTRFLDEIAYLSGHQ